MRKPLYCYNLEKEPISTVLTTQWIDEDTTCLIFPGLMPPLQELFEISNNHQRNKAIEKEFKEILQKKCIELLDRTQCMATLLNYTRYIYWSNRIVPVKELKIYADLLEEMPLIKNGDNYSVWGTAYLVIRCQECNRFFMGKQYKNRTEVDSDKFNILSYNQQSNKCNCPICIKNKQKENLKQRKREEILKDKNRFSQLVYRVDDKDYQYKKLSEVSSFSSPGLNLYNLIFNNFKTCKTINNYFKAFVEEQIPEYFDYCNCVCFITPAEYVIVKKDNFIFDMDDLQINAEYCLSEFSKDIGQENTNFQRKYVISNYRKDNLWFDIPLLNYLIYLGWNPSEFIYDVSVSDRCLWIHCDFARKNTFEKLKAQWYKIEDEYFCEVEDIWHFENTYYKHEAECTYQTISFLRKSGLKDDINVKFKLFDTPNNVFKLNTRTDSVNIFAQIEKQLAETSEYWRKHEILKQAPKEYFNELKLLSREERFATQNWDAVRKIILKHNNFECALKNEVTRCGSGLEVHHKTYEYWGYEHLYLESCIVLCSKHHSAAHYDKH